MSLLRRIRWRWVTVFALIGVVFGLGFVGFQEHLMRVVGERKSGWDVAYLTVQLFFLESGAVDGPVGIELEIARFLAPVMTAYALVQAVLALFAVQVQRTWLWLRAGHVVVCGLGRKGARLVQELRNRGRRVVVIERNQNNDDLPQCRALGAITILGSASDEWTLRKSYVHRADCLIAVTGDDGTNVETGVRAHKLNEKRAERRPPLECIVHVGEPRLRMLFQEHRLYGDPDDPFELRLFNVFEAAARAMLREPPVLLPLDGGADRAPHLLVVGLGHLGEALVRRALKDWRIDHPQLESRLHITIVDAQAASREERFRLRYPDLARTAELRFVSMDAHSADFARGGFLAQQAGRADIRAAYVCLDDDSAAMSAALTVRRFFDNERTPVAVRMSKEAGLAAVLGTGGKGDAAIAGVRAVCLSELTCRREVVLGGPFEDLAQAIHQAYLYDRLAEGQPFGSSPSLVSWDHLPEDLKDSNRQQARHVPTKLSLIGCKMHPSTEDEIPLIEFTAEEIDRLAEDEHRRWLKERQAAGWTFASQKDHQRKKSPYLVPWEELTDEVKGYDRKIIRRLPANLAKADYEIRRTS